LNQYTRDSAVGSENQLLDQILGGARDQLRLGRIDAAVTLLGNAVELITVCPQAASHRSPAQLRQISALIEAGTRFWANWAALVSPDAGLYTATGTLTEPLAGARRIALRA
jgi:phospholipase/lecithinase/hemolysin